MKTIKFLVVGGLIWFPVMLGLDIAADASRIPHSNIWVLLLHLLGAGMAACAAWVVVGAARAKTIAEAIMGIIGVITNLVYLVCFVMGAAAVVMIFGKGSNWVYERLYDPYVIPWITVSKFSLVPIALFLMIFRKTRALGGISLYLISLFLAFTLWFYSLMVAGSHGPGWVIGGLLMAGLGVFITAIVSSAVWGQWSVAGNILFIAALIFVARMFGQFVAGWQFEKDEDAERSAEPHITNAN